MIENDNNNRNQDNSSGNANNSQNPNNNNLPEYSFWAEQAPGSTYTNGSQRNSTYANANQTNNTYMSNPNIDNTNYNRTNANNSYQNYPYTNYDPRTNTWEHGNSQTMNSGTSDKKKERKPGNKALKFVAKALCFGIIAGVSFVGFQQFYYVISPDAASNKIISDLGKNTPVEAKYEIGYTALGKIKLENKSTISGIVEETSPSIVAINSTATQTNNWFGQPYSEEVEGSGSGFIVGKNEEELLIATNNHVVEGTDKITVTFIDGSEAAAVIKGTDATADLAVVSVDISTIEKSSLDVITVVKLGNSDEVKVGEMSIAIGNALGYGQSVTVGYISAKDREVEVGNGYTTNKMILLQTDAAINPGNSGGALLNVKGEVIGINTVKYASNEVEGMGYAIPISKATPIINELMSREILAEEEQGYLGIMGNDVTEEVASYYNMPIGVFIKEVSKDGAAQEAGLISGDIIIAANEIEITSITQLRDYVNSQRVGTEVEITYMRKSASDYQEGKVTVTLAKNPNLESTVK